MSLEQFLMMRNEMLLTLMVVLVIIMEVIFNDDRKKALIPVFTSIFFLITAAGFIPAKTGTLFGGMYVSTDLTIFVKNILNVAALIVFLISAGWLRSDNNHSRISEFFLILTSTLIGMNFMVSAGDFLMLYVGIELASIPMAILAAYDKFKTRSAEAGIKYILSSALSSGLLLFGISYIYGVTGSVYFEDVAMKITTDPLMVLGMIFFITGMGFKISLVPFHLWTADVYEGAPIGVTSFLSVASKGAAAFVFATVLFTVFSPLKEVWHDILYILSILTMTIGNLFAIRQKNMKRFLAFSSIAQAGFILLGILGQGGMGVATVVYFIMIYVFSNLAAFAVVSSIADKTGKENMDDYNGLYKTNPKLSLTLMLALFSLAGIPPVAGFFGKFFLFTSAASSGYYWLVFIAVLNATVSLYYYLLPVKAVFINKSELPIEKFKSGASVRLAMIICVTGLFVIGFASVLYDYLVELSAVFN